MWKRLPFTKSKKVTKKPKIRVENKEKCVDNKREEKKKLWENDWDVRPLMEIKEIQ